MEVLGEWKTHDFIDQIFWPRGMSAEIQRFTGKATDYLALIDLARESIAAARDEWREVRA